MKGIVKFYKQEEGYGFIFCEDLKEDFYFNIKEWKNGSVPCGNDEVTFESAEGKKGKFAKNILLEKSASEKKESKDDRVACPHCGKRCVPRIQFYRGNPCATLCPYCGGVIKQIRKNKILFIFITILLSLVFLTFLLPLLIGLFGELVS